MAYSNKTALNLPEYQTKDIPAWTDINKLSEIITAALASIAPIYVAKAYDSGAIVWHTDESGNFALYQSNKATSATWSASEWTKTDLKTLLANTETGATPDLSNYVTKTALQNELSGYAKSSDLNKYATVASLDSYAKTTDLAAYATTASLASYAKASELTNLVQYDPNASVSAITVDEYNKLKLHA